MVVGKRDERADIVEKGRILEKLALPIAIIMQFQFLCAVEELQHEAGHRAGVRLVDPAGAPQLQDAAFARREFPEEGEVLDPGKVVHQQAVLKAPARDAE